MALPDLVWKDHGSGGDQTGVVQSLIDSMMPMTTSPSDTI